MTVSYVFLLVFVCVVVYLSWFMVTQGDTYRNNGNNTKRLAQLEDKFLRGEIRASDGTVLATTSVDDDGTETRVYPFGSAFAHVVGYTINGVTGIEASGSSWLLDTHTNPLLRIIEALRGIKSSGDAVITTLNVNLQQAAYSALEGEKGAIVVMDPTTGAVLAMVSRPGFNPNTLKDDWESYVSDESNSNLVNRATQGLYTPGSTFKILTTLEYMREFPNSWNSFTFDCDSTYEVDEYTISCSHGTAHGEEDITQAFARSCNGAFASIGEQLNFRKFHELCESIGFNSRPDTSVPIAASSFTLDNNNSTWNILQTAIGQGETQVTPIFNCMIAGAVANGGVMMNPYLIDSVVSKYNDRVASFAPREWKRLMTEEEAESIAAMMREVVANGTGNEVKGKGYTAYGKTGSAEISKGKNTHAWFTGYAVDDDTPGRKLAIAVIVEQGGSGGSVAAPMAKEVFDTWFGE